jgi:hypothetical protein
METRLAHKKWGARRAGSIVQNEPAAHLGGASQTSRSPVTAVAFEADRAERQGRGVAWNASAAMVMLIMGR